MEFLQQKRAEPLVVGGPPFYSFGWEKQDLT